MKKTEDRLEAEPMTTPEGDQGDNGSPPPGALNQLRTEFEHQTQALTEAQHKYQMLDAEFKNAVKADAPDEVMEPLDDARRAAKQDLAAAERLVAKITRELRQAERTAHAGEGEQLTIDVSEAILAAVRPFAEHMESLHIVGFDHIKVEITDSEVLVHQPKRIYAEDYKSRQSTGKTRKGKAVIITDGPTHVGQTFKSFVAAWRAVRGGRANVGIKQGKVWLTNHGYTFTIEE